MYPAYTMDGLFSTYKHKIYRLALSISRNEKDAEDIVQDTFLRVSKSLKKFKGRSRVSTWIYRIAYNSALMHLRKKRRQFQALGRLRRYEEKSPPSRAWLRLADEQLLHKELTQRIEAALNHMPIHYRMPLLLHYREGMSLKDASSVLGLKINSLKTRLHRSHLALKSAISDYFNDKEAQGASRQCPLYTRFISRYLQGSLNEKTKRAFQKHISQCSSCTSFLTAYRKAIALTKSLECQDIPFELQQRIKSFFQSLRRE